METLCCSSPQVSTIKSVSTSGGSISVVQGNLGYIGGALTNGNVNLYWTEGGPTLAALGFDRIAKSPLAGGTVETVASGIVSISPRFLMIDQFIYIADGAALKKLPVTRGFPEFLSPLKTSTVVSLNFDGFATDGSSIYFKNPYSAHFVATPIDGSPPSELPGDFVLDDAKSLTFVNGRLYWLDKVPGSKLKSLPKTGGTISTLLT